MQGLLVRLGVGLRRRRRSITSAAAIAAGAAVALMGIGTAGENQLRALRDTARTHSASGEIHIVEIDANSLDRLDRWPWPRGYHARAIDRLHAAGARSIAFDVDFSSRSTPVEDARLAAALERAGGAVTLSTFRQFAGAARERVIENLPIPALREHAFLAGVTIRPDADGAIRRTPLGVVTGGSPRPSLAAMVAEANSTASDYFAIDYSIDPATIPRHSFVDLIEGRIPPAALRGKRVIIGATAIEIGDRYTVPRYGVVPGVVVQALAAETLLQGGVPRQFGPIVPLLIAALGAVALAHARWRPVRAALFAIASGAVLAGPLATEALLATSFQVAPALALLLFAAMLAIGFKLLDSFLRRLLSNVETGLPNLFALDLALAASPAVRLAVARIDDFPKLSSGVGQRSAAELVGRIAERLALASGGAPIHRIDESALAWTIAADDEGEIDDAFEAIEALMRAPVQCGGRPVDVSLHFGVAEGAGAATAQLAADALLAATQASTNGTRWERFVAGSQQETEWRLSLLGELDRAIEAGDVWVAYQPKLDIATGEIGGAEALARWDHPVRGTIRPDHFIPLVEENGRIDRLTEHVLRTALADAATMSRPISVSVNIAANLLARPGIVEMVRDALAASGVAAARLTLEITESAAMVDPDKAMATLDALTALGIKLSIDDYGTGQSTLTYLKRLPASELKIDKSFVQAINSSHSDAILVGSTINLAHQLGLSVVAEGVEDRACLDRLTEMGCDVAQGYLVGRPMRFDQLVGLLETGKMRAAA